MALRFARYAGCLILTSRLLERAWNGGARSPSLLQAMVREHVEQHDLEAADHLIDRLSEPEVGPTFAP